MANRPAWADHDPEYERELASYRDPIPSRAFIIERLAAAGRPTTLQRFCDALDIVDADRRQALDRRFGAMLAKGQLIRNRAGEYLPPAKADLIRGRVVAHPDGFGFLAPDDGSRDLFLHAREMRALLHGDRILAHVRGVDARGRREGALVEVLERGNHEVVGRLFEDNGAYLVAPDNKRFTQDVLIGDLGRFDVNVGQIVVAAIEQQPTKHMPPVGRIVEVLGEHMAPGMEIDVAIRAHQLPHQWPAAVMAEIADLSTEVPASVKRSREDLTKLPFVTIDGADAQDFDDAVYAKRTLRGWRLWVAIADVAHYVRPATALDSEALNRGNSVYFPGRVIPMLPEVLSNGLCSLNPGVDRLAMVCEITFSRSGELRRSRFINAVIRSRARLVYDDVGALLAGDPTQRARYAELTPQLEVLHGLYHVLRAQREARGAIDLETTETRVIYGEDRKIDRIEPVQRNDAHKLIEECMLAANRVTAMWLAKRQMPALFRGHEGPSADKLETVRGFLNDLGLTLGGGDEPAPMDYKPILDAAKQRPDSRLIQTVILRSMSQAAYTPEHESHFGLAYDLYAHFTSPIRRYPDLATHRAVKHQLAGGKARTFVHNAVAMEELADHCSMTERRADDATREAMLWLKCEFMLDRVGEDFDGLIAAVTSFGLFVELKSIYVEGLVHISTLESDYYHFDPRGHSLTGERSGRTHRLGDSVRVRIVRVDLDQRKIDCQLLSGGRGGANGKARAPRAGGRDEAVAKAGKQRRRRGKAKRR